MTTISLKEVEKCNHEFYNRTLNYYECSKCGIVITFVKVI